MKKSKPTTSKLSIVIPLKVNRIKDIEGMVECLGELTSQKQTNNQIIREIIIVNDCSLKIFHAIDEEVQRFPLIRNVKLPIEVKTGLNGKLNALEYSLRFIDSNYVLFMDDDCRPSLEFLKNAIEQFDKYSCFKCMVSYKNPTIFDEINLCGIYIINLLCSDKQFWGHLFFNRTHLLQVNLPSKDVLFDDLAIYLQFKKNGLKTGYESSNCMDIISNTNASHFFQQRIRYAYENLAYPLRFFLFLITLPTILLTTILLEIKAGLLLFMLLNLFLILIAAMGQVVYSKCKTPSITFILAPLWFWFYPIMSWLALFLRMISGVRFGENMIKKAV